MDSEKEGSPKLKNIAVGSSYDFEQLNEDVNLASNQQVQDAGKRENIPEVVQEDAKDDTSDFNDDDDELVTVIDESDSYDDLLTDESDPDETHEASCDPNVVRWYKKQLNWNINQVRKEHRHSKEVEELLSSVCQIMRKTVEESQTFRERTQRYLEQTKEEMDNQYQFFKDQLMVIHDAISNEKEGHFDKLQEEEKMRVEKSYSVVDPQKRDEKLDEMKEFDEEEEAKLMKMFEERKAEMMSRHFKEEIELENSFKAMYKDSPKG